LLVSTRYLIQYNMRLLCLIFLLALLSSIQAFTSHVTPLKITFNVVSRRKISRTTPTPVIRKVNSGQSKISNTSSSKKGSSKTKQTFGYPGVPFFPRPSDRFTTGNIIEQAEAQAEFTILILKSFKGDSTAAQYIEPIFSTSKCLDNLEDVSKLIEQGTKLIVDNGPDIIYLEAIVSELKDEKDVVKLLKASSKMLRILDSLLPSLTAPSSNICISSPEDSVEGFKDLARVLADITNNRNIDVPPRGRKILAFSSNVMSETAHFLQTLNKQIEVFKTQCETGNKNHDVVYNLIRNILESLAGLFESIGLEDKSVDIRKMAEFLTKIVEVFDGIEDFDTTLDCSFDDSYISLAQVLDDLVEIVQSVGIETLAKELGIDLDFINSL